MHDRVTSIALCLVSWLLAGPVLAQQPAVPQPKAEELQPGLAVAYSYGLFQNVREVPQARQQPGPPLTQLDFLGEPMTNVLTSQNSEGVGADINGFIKLDTPGTWTFQVKSNDGVRVTLGGKEILNDPFVHADQVAKSAPITVKEPGWYALKVLYFQRKGSSALVLYWQKPDGALEVVPAAAFARAHD